MQLSELERIIDCRRTGTPRRTPSGAGAGRSRRRCSAIAAARFALRSKGGRSLAGGSDDESGSAKASGGTVRGVRGSCEAAAGGEPGMESFDQGEGPAGTPRLHLTVPPKASPFSS